MAELTTGRVSVLDRASGRRTGQHRPEATTAASVGDFYGIAAPTAWAGFQGWCLGTMVQAADPGLDGQTYNYNTQQYEAQRLAPAIQMYRDLVANEIAFPGAETMSIDDAGTAFVEERAAMLVMGGMAVATFAGFAFAMNSEVEDTEAAATVMETLTGASVQAELAAKVVPPLFTEAWESPAVEQVPQLKDMQPGELDKQLPRSPGSLLSPEGLIYAEVVNKLVLEPNSDIEAELDDYQQRFQDAFDKAVADGTLDIAAYGG